jgi:hypothetical protein
MDKRQLSERDICTKFITPALRRAGWDEMLQIREEVSFTKGRAVIWALYKKEMQPFTRFYPDDDDPWGGRLVVRREETPVGAGSALLLSPFPSSSGSRAMLTATRRASSFVSTFVCRASASLAREYR